MRRSLHGALAAALLGACTQPATQLVVVVDSDLAPSEYACVGVVVSRVEGGALVQGDRRMFDVPGLVAVPFSFGVVPPDGDASRRVEIRAEAWPSCDEPAPGAAPLVSRAVRTGFLAGQTLRVPMFLGARCRMVECPEPQTCDPGAGVCEVVPELPPESLSPVRPGDELRDGGAGGGADASPPSGECTPVAPLVIRAGNAVGFEVAPRPAAREWLLLASTDTGVALDTFALDGTGVTARAPLSTGVGANGIAAVVPPGTDDALVAVWRNDLARVDRHVVRDAIAGAVTPDFLLGSLRQRGVAAALGGDALIAHDEQGLGDPLVVRRMAASGASAVVFRSAENRDVALAPRASGGALAALTDGATAGRCDVIAIAPGGGAAAPSPVPADVACVSVGIAELSDGRVALVYVNGDAAARRASFALLDAGLTTVVMRGDLGAAAPGRVSVTAGADGSFRALWPSAELTTARVDAAGAVGPLETLTVAGADPTTARAARQGRTTAVVLRSGTALHFAALCD